MATHNSQLSLDDVFNALSNTERRKLLDSLIADSPSDDAGSSGIKVDADLAMYHSHLPRLADYGLINWDKETNWVTKGPNFDAAEKVLDFLSNNDGILPPTKVEI